MGTEAAMPLLIWDSLVSLALAGAIFLLLVDLMHRRPRWASRYPPGPISLPVLGNLLQMDFQNMLFSVNQVRKVAGWTPPGGRQWVGAEARDRNKIGAQKRRQVGEAS